MDPQKTAAFELGGGDDACLLIHGFTGSPWEMRPLGEFLAARGYYVKAPRLPGHGTTPEAMEHVTHRDWEQASEDALDSLKNFRQVFVAGLSMGALLSLLLAAHRPERVHGLALMAPAMRFQEPRLKLLKAISGVPWLEMLKPRIEKESSDIEDPHVRGEAPLMSSFPSARLYDLYEVQERARAALALVNAATLVMMAEQDHVVAVEGGREIVRGLVHAPTVRFLKVRQGFHIMPRDRGQAVVLSEVSDFFERLRG